MGDTANNGDDLTKSEKDTLLVDALDKIMSFKNRQYWAVDISETDADNVVTTYNISLLYDKDNQFLKVIDTDKY